jgi:predicted  nucleic acid-binding Zn-ribbon protein
MTEMKDRLMEKRAEYEAEYSKLKAEWEKLGKQRADIDRAMSGVQTNLLRYEAALIALREVETEKPEPEKTDG